MLHSPQILILANSSIFSSGIKSILEKAEFFVFGEAQSWKELFEILVNIKPQLLLLDLYPFLDCSMEWLGKLRTEYPTIPVVLIIKDECTDYFREYILLGIRGLIFSNTSPGDFIKAIEQVADGKEYFPVSMLNIFNQTEKTKEDNNTIPNINNILTPREIVVCKLFSNGLTYKEIAFKLFISPRTVESHKKNILSKLKIKSTADIVKYAIHHHLI